MTAESHSTGPGTSDLQHAKSDSGDSRRAQQPIPVLEWIVAALGGALVLGTLLFMTWDAVRGDRSPPDIMVTVDSVVVRQSGYLVTIRAHNAGGTTAENVTVEGVLALAGDSTETASAVLDYLPAHSTRGGGLFFLHDPRTPGSSTAHRIRVRALGYQEP